jgi:hypothetical protein
MQNIIRIGWIPILIVILFLLHLSVKGIHREPEHSGKRLANNLIKGTVMTGHLVAPVVSQTGIDSWHQASFISLN